MFARRTGHDLPDEAREMVVPVMTAKASHAVIARKISKGKLKSYRRGLSQRQSK